MRGPGIAAIVMTVAAIGLALPASACGGETACLIEGGEYRIRMPQDWDGESKIGAIVFLHGWRGTAGGEMRNKALTRAASDLGVALIAPQGAEQTWSFPGSPSHHRDEIAFFNTLLDDVLQRFPIDRSRIMASGFSMGGSMVWHLACRMSDRFAGFAPIAGGYWDPAPENCDGPVPNLIHVHGTADRTVPIEGRPIGTFYRQGDIIKGMDKWVRIGRCVNETPVHLEDGRLTCERRRSCTGALIELCLHPGGHSLRTEWVTRAWQALAARLDWSGAPPGNSILQ